MVQRILVPLDGSAVAERTLPYVVALHRAFGSEVILFRVVEAEPGRPGLFSESMGWRLAEAEGRSYLKKMAGRLHEHGIEAEIDMAAGQASTEILDAIRRWDADLVVLAPNGSGKIDFSPSGGTSGKVISSADSSFLLVQASTEVNPAESPVRRVVVPMDGSPRSEWALNLAAALARANGVELILVHVVARPELLQGAGASTEVSKLADQLVEANRVAGLQYLEERKRQLSSSELPVSIRMAVAGSVPRAIHGLAFREEGSLLVLSAHGRAPGSGWPYGGVAWTLLSGSPGSTLVFQDLPRRRPERTDRRGRYARVPSRFGGPGSE